MLLWTYINTHFSENLNRDNKLGYSPLSNALDHQVGADVKGDFLSNFLYILIIFK